MGKHTPGPWEIHGAERQAGRFSSSGTSIRGSDGHDICDLRWNGLNEVRGLSNARLIAAAPDLLAALEAIQARIVGEFDHPALMAFGLLTPDTLYDVARIVAIVHLAIAKAEGK